MSKERPYGKQPSTSPFKVMEEEAYHAFLEWPIWLVLREKELTAYLAADPSQPDCSGASCRFNHLRRKNNGLPIVIDGESGEKAKIIHDPG